MSKDPMPNPPAGMYWQLQEKDGKVTIQRRTSLRVACEELDLMMMMGDA